MNSYTMWPGAYSLDIKVFLNWCKEQSNNLLEQIEKAEKAIEKDTI